LVGCCERGCLGFSDIHHEHPKIGIILTLPRRPVFDQFRWSRQGPGK
jgi:hypothetical protein